MFTLKLWGRILKDPSTIFQSYSKVFQVSLKVGSSVLNNRFMSFLRLSLRCFEGYFQMCLNAALEGLTRVSEVHFKVVSRWIYWFFKDVLLYDRVWGVFEKCLTFSFFFCVRCAVIVFLIHFRVKRERLNILEAFLSNSTPTCRPNSTLVGWSRIWLCFPMSQE